MRTIDQRSGCTIDASARESKLSTTPNRSSSTSAGRTLDGKSTERNLTALQRDTLRFMREFKRKTGRNPGYKQFVLEYGVNQATIKERLDGLARHGAITRSRPGEPYRVVDSAQPLATAPQPPPPQPPATQKRRNFHNQNRLQSHGGKKGGLRSEADAQHQRSSNAKDKSDQKTNQPERAQHPCKDADHFHFPQREQQMPSMVDVERVGRDLLRNLGNPDDCRVVWQVAWLVAAGLLAEHSAIDAACGPREVGGIRNVVGYFRKSLATDLGREKLETLLKSVPRFAIPVPDAAPPDHHALMAKWVGSMNPPRLVTEAGWQAQNRLASQLAQFEAMQKAGMDDDGEESDEEDAGADETEQSTEADESGKGDGHQLREEGQADQLLMRAIRARRDALEAQRMRQRKLILQCRRRLAQSASGDPRPDDHAEHRGQEDRPDAAAEQTAEACQDARNVPRRAPGRDRHCRVDRGQPPVLKGGHDQVCPARPVDDGQRRRDRQQKRLGASFSDSPTGCRTWDAGRRRARRRRNANPTIGLRTVRIAASDAFRSGAIASQRAGPPVLHDNRAPIQRRYRLRAP